MEETEIIKWLVGGVSTVLTVLASVIGYLYNKSEKRTNDALEDHKNQIVSQKVEIIELRKEADECQEDRVKLWQRIHELETK